VQDSPHYVGRIVLVAASLVAAVLGSIHAFSVFLEPLETLYGTPRSDVSLTYSMALVALTFAVLMGPKVFGRGTAASFILTVCALAACGALLASAAGSLPVIWIGYSLVFGLANGLGYGFGLQISAQYNPGREGFAMGAVTAAYALGAVLSAPLFDFAVSSAGFAAAMTALAVAMLCAGLLSAALFRSVGATFRTVAGGRPGTSTTSRSVRLLWFGYFGGVLAGLMIIGHAAGISASLRPGLQSWIAPVTIAMFNLMGSLVAGRLADRLPLGGLLASLTLLTTVALAGLAVFGKTFGVLGGLGLVGFAYGGTIAAYPAAIAKRYGIHHGARVYGRVFTAWGCAGLVGPWFAGLLFDWGGDYRAALLTAAAVGLMSVGVVSLAFRQDGVIAAPLTKDVP
jgi:OFA family oxalate/formate antiporter-like MFS transporter